MGEFLAYNLHVAVYLAVLYLIYKVAISTERQAALNRAVVLGIFAVAFMAWPVRVWVEALTQPDIVGMTTADLEVGEMIAAVVPTSPPIWPRVLIAIYIFGIAAILCLTALQFVSMLRLIASGGVVTMDGYRLVVIDDHRVAPFSWGRYVVINARDFAETPDYILAHELGHIRHHHTVDLMLVQILCVVQWFNPAAWLLRNELQTLHEYQADRHVMASGANLKEYQMLLIKKAVGTRFQSLANSLNHSNLKKRIIMMYKTNPSGARRLRALALVPAMALAVAVVNHPSVSAAISVVGQAKMLNDRVESLISDYTPASTNTAYKVDNGVETNGTLRSEVCAKLINDEAKGEIFDKGSENSSNPETSGSEKIEATEVSTLSGEAPVFADKLPEFPGGMGAMMKYLNDNIRYPESAQREKRQGKVAVAFTVESDGRITGLKLLNGVSDDLNAEAFRVISSMPRWTPAVKDGKNVAVGYALPVTFKLSTPNQSKQDKGEGKKVSQAIFVDGQLYHGELSSLDPSEIESMTIVKNRTDYPQGVIEIKLKK